MLLRMVSQRLNWTNRSILKEKNQLFSVGLLIKEINLSTKYSIHLKEVNFPMLLSITNLLLALVLTVKTIKEVLRVANLMVPGT